mmetsp:Transcript_18406/g.46378  ORF Transcript_18406/g.46378 Transcript_18406/m.46378 type:complete len:214 (+) Transcript_18406:228-869(+)
MHHALGVELSPVRLQRLLKRLLPQHLVLPCSHCVQPHLPVGLLSVHDRAVFCPLGHLLISLCHHIGHTLSCLRHEPLRNSPVDNALSSKDPCPGDTLIVHDPKVVVLCTVHAVHVSDSPRASHRLLAPSVENLALLLDKLLFQVSRPHLELLLQGPGILGSHIRGVLDRLFLPRVPLHHRSVVFDRVNDVGRVGLDVRHLRHGLRADTGSCRL